ncbi:MAG: hypothetical protein Q9180_001343 [Flavoplaca navasiana]
MVRYPRQQQAQSNTSIIGSGNLTRENVDPEIRPFATPSLHKVKTPCYGYLHERKIHPLQGHPNIAAPLSAGLQQRIRHSDAHPSRDKVPVEWCIETPPGRMLGVEPLIPMERELVFHAKFGFFRDSWQRTAVTEYAHDVAEIADVAGKRAIGHWNVVLDTVHGEGGGKHDRFAVTNVGVDG